MTNILIQPPVGSSLTLNWPNKKIPQTAPSSSFQQTAGSGTTDSHLLFLADTKAALVYLNEHFSGRVDLIYLDPPFASQATYHQRTASGEKIPQYDDHWDDSRYLQFLLEVLLLLRMLMSDKGTLYLHCDHHHQHHLRMVLDEVFGAKHFMNHLVWGYKTGGVPEKKGFSKKHDDILVYSKGPNPIFHRQQQRSYVASLPEPHTKSGQRLGVHRDTTCELCKTGQPGPKYRMVVCRDVWTDIPSLFRNAPERTNYPTQKPEALLQRIIKTSSDQNSIVLDPFCGSGTTLAAAHALRRRSIGIDCNPVAIQYSAMRLGSFHRYQQCDLSFKQCCVTFEQRDGLLVLASYLSADQSSSEAQTMITTIWIEFNPSEDHFRPDVVERSPVPLSYSIPKTSTSVRIEVVDVFGSIWQRTLQIKTE